MATILKHKKTNEEYLLLGAGYGRSHGAYNLREGETVGFLDTKHKPRTLEETKICVCKKDGKIIWVQEDDLEVVRVDGKTLDSIFG
ncbi:hypothetical protein [uncultured Mediterranean phage uvMED]|nr:hypothetical protein [uncultured Mediterranean phage uvMED]